MKKIAVLRCLRTSNNCTGSGCLKAFNNKTNAFAVYEAEETELAAFLNCSGCGDVQMPNNEEGLRKKLDLPVLGSVPDYESLKKSINKEQRQESFADKVRRYSWKR